MTGVTSVAEYRKRIAEAIIGDRTGTEETRAGFEYGNASEARIVLKEIRMIQERLRTIKKDINQDISVIRNDDNGQTESAGSGSGLAGLPVGEGRAGPAEASDKRRLRHGPDGAVTAYLEVKSVIDKALSEFDKGKLQIEKYLANLQG